MFLRISPEGLIYMNYSHCTRCFWTFLNHWVHLHLFSSGDHFLNENCIWQKTKKEESNILMDVYVPHTYIFLKIGWSLLPLLTFLLENLAYLLIIEHSYFGFYAQLLWTAKKRISISPKEWECCNCYSEEHKAVFERDIKTLVFLCKDGLCSVHMNCPKQQVKMNHQFLTTKRKRPGNGSIFITFKYRDSF